MIQCLRSHFESRCRWLGVDLKSARDCVADEDGEYLVVDETHSAYPRRPPPSLLQKAANLAKATARHVANGGRQCSDEEIAARYAVCEACPLLVDGHCTHKNCGCEISATRALVSKLSWASEKCPLGKW